MKGLKGSDVPFMTRRVRDSEPVAERSRNPEPVAEPSRTSEPVAEPSRTPEPVVERSRNPEPVVERSRNPEPVAEPSRTPEPVVERSRNPLDLGESNASGPLRSAPSPSAGLDLSPGPATQRPPAGRPRTPSPATPEARLYPAPAFGALHQLAEGDAVVRLNPRQSGIGSLFVTGARGTAWEGEDRTTGAQSVHREQIGTPIPTPGNRPLVGFVNRDAVVVLRHVRKLRRALFIGAGGTMTVQTFDGSAIAVQGTLGPGQRTVLTATRIGALLELRAESVPEDWDDGEIWREFAFTMTVGLGGPRR